MIERDVMELTRIRQRRQLPLLLRQLASQTGQVLNIAKAATAIGMDKSTAENYTKLLEAVFLVHQLPAWGTTLGPQIGAAPKVHIVDSGLAARLLRLTDSKLGTRPAAGGLRGLLALRRKLGSQFLGVVVLYTSAHAYTHDSGCTSYPSTGSGTRNSLYRVGDLHCTVARRGVGPGGRRSR